MGRRRGHEAREEGRDERKEGEETDAMQWVHRLLWASSMRRRTRLRIRTNRNDQRVCKIHETNTRAFPSRNASFRIVCERLDLSTKRCVWVVQTQRPNPCTRARLDTSLLCTNSTSWSVIDLVRASEARVPRRLVSHRPMTCARKYSTWAPSLPSPPAVSMGIFSSNGAACVFGTCVCLVVARAQVFHT